MFFDENRYLWDRFSVFFFLQKYYKTFNDFVISTRKKSDFMESVGAGKWYGTILKDSFYQQRADCFRIVEPKKKRKYWIFYVFVVGAAVAKTVHVSKKRERAELVYDTNNSIKVL